MLARGSFGVSRRTSIVATWRQAEIMYAFLEPRVTRTHRGASRGDDNTDGHYDKPHSMSMSARRRHELRELVRAGGTWYTVRTQTSDRTERAGDVEEGEDHEHEHEREHTSFRRTDAV